MLAKYNGWAWIALAALLVALGIMSYVPFGVLHGDLGRHLMNGKQFFLHLGEPHVLSELLKTNYYSYSHPNFPFMNHHWGSGVLVYVISVVSGFGGLHILAFLLVIVPVLVMYELAARETNRGLAFAVTLFLLPLLTERSDIRPELWSVFFASIFFALLWKFRSHGNATSLYAVPVLFLVWVNLHIYFFLGILLLILFLGDLLLSKKYTNARILAKWIGVTIVAGCVNPFGPALYAYPFRVLNGTPLVIQEMQPVYSGAASGLGLVQTITLFMSLCLFWSACVWLHFWQKKQVDVLLLLVAMSMSAFGMVMIRNVTVFGIFFVFLLAYIFHAVWQSLNHSTRRRWSQHAVRNGVLICFFVVILQIPRWQTAFAKVAAGETPMSDGAAGFVRSFGGSGQLFNDYDSGGYIIYNLFPKFRPYIDNRPEAYPPEFSSQDYEQARADEAVWKRVDDARHFSMIVQYRKNRSRFTEPFISRRLRDPQWAPVYFDSNYIVFFRRIPEYASVIKEFEIPVDIKKKNP